jgi:hypothetical protein
MRISVNRRIEGSFKVSYFDIVRDWVIRQSKLVAMKVWYHLRIEFLLLKGGRGMPDV